MKTYPVFFIGLHDRSCLVIGSGADALRKIDGLLECDASVTVIAAEICSGIHDHVRSGRVRWIARNYRQDDLTGAFLVIVAQQDATMNARIFAEAAAAGIPINVMDDVDHCNFIAGSVVRRGALTVAISTGGCAPALAVRLRERLERTLGPEHDLFLRWMRKLRGPLASRYPDFEQRRRVWYELVDSDVLDLLRNGKTELARRRVRALTPGKETSCAH